MTYPKIRKVTCTLKRLPKKTNRGDNLKEQTFMQMMAEYLRDCQKKRELFETHEKEPVDKPIYLKLT